MKMTYNISIRNIDKINPKIIKLLKVSKFEINTARFFTVLRELQGMILKLLLGDNS